MIDTIVTKINKFRNTLYNTLKFRRDATMDLIDAIAANGDSSVVKSSLSLLFRRTYSSITDVLDNLFRLKAEENPTDLELAQEQLKMTQLLAAGCPLPKERGFTLLATDCTAKPRIYSEKVTDRSIVHAPNHIPGQKPITVGHEYSLVVFLPEEEQDRNAHWVCPLSIKRVQSHEKGTQVGLEQVKHIVTETHFRNSLCVNVADAAYSNRDWIIGVEGVPNLVSISRLRSNRVLFQTLKTRIEKKGRGRPKVYGNQFRLDNPPSPDEQICVTHITKKGKCWTVCLSRWNDVLTRGKKDQSMEKLPFDVVRAEVLDEDNEPVFSRPLSLSIVGKRRIEITTSEAYECYCQRYDIEHCFRFGKQKLTLISSQTPDTRHEENHAWIAMLAYAMLFHARHLVKERYYPWEKRKVSVLKTLPTPTQAQRDYTRIIKEIGTPASIPKPRGKSSGRSQGATVFRRPKQPLIRKKHVDCCT